ncbi:MAG: 3-isopropylmalate dehydratase small subunit [Pseudomonadota bacterium]
MMQPFRTLTSRTLVLREENIDTDQIIPARFLTTTERDGLADACFHDWRFDSTGRLTDHVLNNTRIDQHQVLVAGDNFGCGSSREHAPWALMALGFRVVISTEIADIFRSNAMKNGLLPICLDAEAHAHMMGNPGAEVSVDLEQETVTIGNHQFPFSTEAFARRCLLEGQDSLDVLVSALPEIEVFEARRP